MKKVCPICQSICYTNKRKDFCITCRLKKDHPERFMTTVERRRKLAKKYRDTIPRADMYRCIDCEALTKPGHNVKYLDQTCENCGGVHLERIYYKRNKIIVASLYPYGKAPRPTKNPEDNTSDGTRES